MNRQMAGIALMSTMILTSCTNESELVVRDRPFTSEEQAEIKGLLHNTNTDSSFTAKVTETSRLELELSMLALQNASSDKVKEFAKIMIAEHLKTTTELMHAAKKDNTILSPSMGSQYQKIYNELLIKKGAEFDKAYMVAVVQAHTDVLNEITKEADTGKDAGLRAWASGKVSDIKYNLDIATSTNGMIK